MLNRVLFATALACLLSTTAAIPAVAFAADPPKKEEKAAAKKDEATYVCPMKCEGSEQKGPGKCPKCGMDLVKKEAAKK